MDGVERSGISIAVREKEMWARERDLVIVERQVRRGIGHGHAQMLRGG